MRDVILIFFLAFCFCIGLGISLGIANGLDPNRFSDRCRIVKNYQKVFISYYPACKIAWWLNS